MGVSLVSPGGNGIASFYPAAERLHGGKPGGRMVFWIIALTIALGVALILSRALAAGATRTISTEAYDLQVYRDQLAEVERDLARGVLGAEDGDRARTEISRKILAADRARRGDEQQAQPRRATAIVAALTGAVVMAGGFGLYLRIGGDGLTDQPMAARIAAAEAARATRLSQAEAEVRAAAEMPAPPAPDPQYARLMEELRAAMAARPDDIKGLRLLVSNEARLGNFSAAAAVQAQVITVRGTGADGEDHAALGELQGLAAGGYVTPEAEASFEASLARDRQNGTARFYLGIAAAQFGRPDQAFVIWRALLEQSPASAPWVPVTT